MSNWLLVLLEPARTVLTQIGQFLVNALLVIIILIIGWVIAKAIKALVTNGLRTVKLDELSTRIELDSLLAKGGIKYSLSELIGVILYWLVLLITFVVAVNAMGLTIAAELLNRIVLYVPRVIAAIFILILGFFVATLLRNIILTAASNAGVSQARFLGKLTEVIIMVIAIAIVFDELNIGARIIGLVITMTLGSIGLGIALAFGLGCKEIAAKFVSETIEKLKKK